MRKERNIYRILVEKSEGKRLLGRSGYRKEDEFKVDLKE
jgi:hypothetical protein